MAAPERVCPTQSHNLLIIESHAVENVAQMLCKEQGARLEGRCKMRLDECLLQCPTNPLTARPALTTVLAGIRKESIRQRGHLLGLSIAAPGPPGDVWACTQTFLLSCLPCWCVTTCTWACTWGLYRAIHELTTHLLDSHCACQRP